MHKALFFLDHIWRVSSNFQLNCGQHNEHNFKDRLVNLTLFPLVSISSTTGFVGILTGNQNLTVFADGCLVGHNGGSSVDAKWFSFSSKTKVIAVSVTNIPSGEIGGFLGIFSNGVVTDSSWKCNGTQGPVNGWEQTNFADDLWPSAFMRFNNSVTKVYGIPPHVRWITDSPTNHLATRIICRRHFSKEKGVSNNGKYDILHRLTCNRAS